MHRTIYVIHSTDRFKQMCLDLLECILLIEEMANYMLDEIIIFDDFLVKMITKFN